ncbi:hypothetical protein [Aureivirga marina]|uniref:hypothetical protein n=1 Tax=Aureivirga marina TaxID=1182451 RepID=UPI0018CA198A|nr:hypothetical protein [Aureivirga marina]
MNLLQKVSRKIIKFAFEFSVSTIERCSKMEKYHQKVDELRSLEKGTLGKEIANCLDQYNLTLVPKYESHDLKHVLLNYDMTAEGEIRMQAFMIGNGNYSVPSFVIFLFGAILLPDLWNTFYSDFKKGRNSMPISNWTIEEYASKSLLDLRNQIKNYSKNKKTVLELKVFTKWIAFATVFAGIFGMIFCLPFLFSSNIADLIGAGFPFVGGAILVTGGLLALSNLSKKDVSKEKTTLVLE